MPTYQFIHGYRGRTVYEIEADSEEEARNLYDEGYGDEIEDETIESWLEEVICLTDENDIEHHVQRS